MNLDAIRAVFLRDFKSYFGNPLGYVFIVAFVLVTGWRAFFPEQFFSDNKANLDLLSEAFPLLLALFIPAVTMASWADERRQGTTDLLFTLPARDHELVLGKYLAGLAIYTVGLLFTLSHVGVLVWLGNPDPGLMLATYLGYWLQGAALVAVGMLASALTSNLTVAYIFGVIFTGALALLGRLQGVELQLWGLNVPGDLLAAFSPASHAEPLSRGVLALEDLLYFPALTWTALFGTTLLVGRRHWTRGSARAVHGTLRLAAILVGTMSLVLVAQRGAARADVTAARMLSLSPEARAVVAAIPSSQPVFVQAWISPQVPGEYVPVRDALLRTLDELDARGGDRLEVAIHPTELYSEEAERAEKSFGIKPRQVTYQEGGQGGRYREEKLFLGLAFTSGAREEVIEFFDKGLPVQYELTRAIGVVADQERAKVGVLSGECKWFGGFDFQSMNSSRDWQVVQDLRRQYEVVDIGGTAPIDTSLSVLVVAQPSALKQEVLNHVSDYLFDGGKVLFLCDPYPVFNLGLAPELDGGQRNPFQPPPPKEKGDVDSLLRAIGVAWDGGRVSWDAHNPHPKFQQFPKEIVFATGATEERPSGFDEQDPVTKGLQEVVLIFPGELEPLQKEGVTVTTLLQTSPSCGANPIRDIVEEIPFLGPRPKPPTSRRYAEPKEEKDRKRRALAVRSRGFYTTPVETTRNKAGTRSAREFQAIVIADVDILSDELYALRREGSDEFDLDNVTLVSNCIDDLAGERAFIELRKQRPRHRTLTMLEEIESQLSSETRRVSKEAGEKAEKELKEAQERLDQAVEELRKRTDMDHRTKDIQLAYVEERERRKLDAEKRRIEDEEQAAVRAAETRAKRSLDARRQAIRFYAVAIPPIPALLLGLIVFLRKLTVEAAGTAPSRRRS